MFAERVVIGIKNDRWSCRRSICRGCYMQLRHGSTSGFPVKKVGADFGQ